MGARIALRTRRRALSVGSEKGDSMKQIDRREFIARNLEGLALAGACACGLSGCATFTKVGKTPSLPPHAYAVEPPAKATVFLDRTPALGVVGGSAKILDPALVEPLIVARVDGERFVAASLRCPHRGVELEYEPVRRAFRCASLGHSRFDLDGGRRGGPAGRPVKIYPCSLEGGNLVIRFQ